MFPFLPSTEAQNAYDGPDELRVFADIMPLLGELAISFSRLERRLTWAIESLIGSTPDEAYEMEDFVKNFSSRLKFLELIGIQVARESGTESDFAALIDMLRTANSFRNMVLHNAFTGMSMSHDGGAVSEVKVLKQRYNAKPEKRQYEFSTSDLRAASIRNLEGCNMVQRWILTVRPDAQNRVP